MIRGGGGEEEEVAGHEIITRRSTTVTSTEELKNRSEPIKVLPDCLDLTESSSSSSAEFGGIDSTEVQQTKRYIVQLIDEISSENKIKCSARTKDLQ